MISNTFSTSRSSWASTTLLARTSAMTRSFSRNIPPHLNRPPRLTLILRLTGECNDGGFLLDAREFAADPGLQLFQKADFLFRRKPDQYRDAITKKNSDAGLANPNRERDC